MASLESAKKLLAEVKAKYESGDVNGGKQLISKLKLLVFDFPSDSLPNWLFATEALELIALITLEDGDLDAFQRSVAQLRPYYATSLGQSSKKSHVLGLHLMHLLIENRLSEFHSELELLTNAEAQDPLITFPINLERQLMVGIYDEVLNVSVPHPSFQFFTDNLLQTVRDNIADCMEVSYKEMEVLNAMRMMKFSTREELMAYVADFRDDWIVEGETICFQPPPTGSSAMDVPSMNVISQSLSYATEMERIV